MFLTALCNHIGVLSRDRVVAGDRGAEFPESPALDTEVIAGPQPGALGFRADAPDVSGAGGRLAQAMEAFHGGCSACVGKRPGHSIARMARYAFADPEAMMP